jgi:ABC-type Mn2+/Zn2+ transport system permease subunit
MLQFFIILIELGIAAFISLFIDALVKNYHFRKDTQRGILGCLMLAISLTIWFGA